MTHIPSSKDTSFEGNFNGVAFDDKKKLATTTMDYKDDDSDDVNFCFNRKRKEFFGRSFLSLIRIGGYMVVYNVCLAVFWGLCLWVFYQTLDNYVPKLQRGSSFIGQNPGLGYKPMRTETNPYSSLIWFKHGGAGDWDNFKRILDEYLVEYEPGYWANAGATQTKCHWDRGPLTEQEACEFNKEWLSDSRSDYKCISEENYGYLHGKPCILVKLNRIYGWNPKPYTIDEVRNHLEMPDRLKQHINQTWWENCGHKGTAHPDYTQCPQLNMVWLHCDGENAPDKENIGTVSYTPWQGFPSYFFPYYNQLGYLQPIVMVQLKNPTPAVLINIECTAWAKVETEEENRNRVLRVETNIENGRFQYPRGGRQRSFSPETRQEERRKDDFRQEDDRNNQDQYFPRQDDNFAQQQDNIQNPYIYRNPDLNEIKHDTSKMRGSIHIELLMD